MIPIHRPISTLLAVAGLGTLAFGLALPKAGPEGTERPNVIMIVVDDMRFDEYGAGGHTFLETPNIDALAAAGASFTNAYHVTPLCSPNRASLLTGQYPSRHGILDNTSRAVASHRLDLFAKDLQAAGYRTGHVGKWHMGNDPTPRPGYDYWVSFAGQGKTNDPDLFERGETHQVEGYITDIFTDRAVGFIEEAGENNQPFFLYIGHKAIHPELQQGDDGSVDPRLGKEFIPAERHRGRYTGRTFERRPSVAAREASLAGKPVIRSALELRQQVMESDPAWETMIDPGIADETIQRRAEMMLAVDESVGRILATLTELGIADETLVLLTSDNGYYFGEHGLTIERRLPYEETLRTPLLIRHPGLIEAGIRPNALVLSIDLAATILDLAGIEVPPTIQGRSLMPVLTGRADSVRETAYMEYYSHEKPFTWTTNLDYRVIRKGSYKYIRWLRFEDAAELYDLEADPYELHNLIDDPAVAAVVADLQEELRQQLLAATGI